MPSKEEQLSDHSVDEAAVPPTAPEVPGFEGVSTLESVEPSIEHTAPEKDSLDSEQTGEVSQDKGAAEEATESMPPPEEKSPEVVKPKRNKKRLLIYGLIILINAAIITATTIVLRSPKKQSVATTASSENTTGSNPEINNNVEPPKNLHYVSDALKLEFDYPSDWRIESSPSNTFITIQSPQTEIKQANGETTKGRVVLEVHAKYTEYFNGTPAIIDDKSIIAEDSERITYKNPTTVQRSETNLSFTRSANVGGSANGFDTVFVSGNLAYKAGAMVRTQAYKTINPFIIMYFNPCQEDNCGAYVPPRVDKAAFKSNQAFSSAKEIIASARFN